ncbi:glutamyl-tRNA reductase [Acidicapsa acidisoli]|uniref:glutamyl-tRNA reductase n=1 Tax=Acidicapsa acidisoli TaxID=1615681 RepID=UPI0021DF99F5|nr:glutamyl-tRNA reductase [Acidicapsa acidisoli]
MSLILLGINHKTAPIELRERVAIPRESLAASATSLMGVSGVSEAMILSTCNRVEILTAAESSDVDIAGFLHRHLGVDPALLKPHLYVYRDREAIRHLFRVAASLDSMVVGEPQILGQVKEAYTVAREAGTVAAQLEPLLQSAFAAAKKVRSETEIGSTTVSIASVAVDLAQKIFGSLGGKKVFLVGAGKMSELAARHLIRHGAGKMFVSNRTPERAVQMAGRFSGAVAPQVVPWEQMREAASSADIVITSTGAAEPIFRKEDGQAFLHKRKNRPMFFIDIAVPRDVDPEMNRLEGIFLYDIDDLQSVAAAHLAERTREAADAEAMIAAEVERYHLKLKAVNVAPAIVGLQQKAEELRLAELKRVQARLGGLTAEQFAAVEALSRGLVNKFLHPPMQALKQAAREGDVARIETIRETYSLGTETGVAGAEEASVGAVIGAARPANDRVEERAPAADQDEPVIEKVGL